MIPRAAIHVSLSLLFVIVAPLLLVEAIAAHDAYAHAHVVAHSALRGVTQPSDIPASLPSVERFNAAAQRWTLGACGLAVVALVAAIRTRHPAWLVCFVACAAIAIVAVVETGRQY